MLDHMAELIAAIKLSFQIAVVSIGLMIGAAALRRARRLRIRKLRHESGLI